VGLVYTQSPSGLVLATQGVDEATAAAALREYDRDLRLVPQDSDALGRRVYKVYRYVGSERDAEFVCFWGDELGNPFPLSVTGLLEMVRRLDRNTRGTAIDPDVHNARLVAQRRKEANDELDAIEQEYRARVDGKKLSPLPRSRNLHLARNRVRRRSPGSDFNP
jgi:hypothetical protein